MKKLLIAVLSIFPFAYGIEPVRYDAMIYGGSIHYSDSSVFQISPKFGFYVGDYYSYGSFYLETRGYYIRLSDDVGFGKNFLSAEQKISYSYKNFVLSLSGWLGEQSFAVKNNGFVVYNLSEKYKSFKEIGSTKTTKATSLFFIYGVTF